MEQNRKLVLSIKYCLLGLVTFIIFISFIVKLYKLQIINGKYYSQLAASQYINSGGDDFERGKIFISKRGFQNVLVADTEERKVGNIDNALVLKNRKYMLGDMASKIVGFVGYDEDNNRVGRYGIEKYYNDILEREKDSKYINPFAEIFGNYKIEDEDDVKKHGDIVLTLDYEVQKYSYHLIREIAKNWNSEEVGIIVMDPSDGKIIAMEELPTFDPNAFNEIIDTKVFLNNSVSSVYEMGSIIKPITIASGLDNKSIDQSTTYNDTGSKIFNGEKVSNYDGVARGVTSMQSILDQSLNLGIGFVVEKMGIIDFQKYFKSFGIGIESGIDLPSETDGLVDNLDSEILLDNVTAGFGQGIAISPLQTVRALSAIGNGGYLVNPYIVSEINYENGDTLRLGGMSDTKVISTSTSEEISRMLVSVVDNYLAKGKYKNDKYSVAGKTGTAQIASKDGYYEDRYLHSIFAYFPAYKPKYLVFIYQVNPRGAEFASQTLSEPLFDMVHYLTDYFELQPDR